MANTSNKACARADRSDLERACAGLSGCSSRCLELKR